MASIQRDSSYKGDANENCDSIPKSHFLKTVCLSDWWLMKAENDPQGGRLSVSGFTSREQRAMRVFSSAAIIKSHDMFTLETIDGIYVLIKGLINKVRTLENGFTSDVFNHFVFGFPPYWKEYAEMSMGRHSYVDDSNERVDEDDSNERVDESGHEMGAKRNSSKSKSSAVILPSDGVIRSTEDNTFFSSTAPVNLEKTISPGNCCSGDHMTTDASVNCFIKKASTTSWFGGNSIISPDGGILFACHLNDENKGTKGKITTDSIGKLWRKHENNQMSDRMLGGYRTRSKSVLPLGCEKVKPESVNFEPRGRNNLSHGEMAKTPIQDRDWRVAETKGSMDEAKDKGTMSQDRHGATDDVKEHAVANENSISEKDGTSKTKTKRKLAYETPGSAKEGVLLGSSKSLSFSRSRSGRLLMPTLKFWCNERALYDAEGNITGIEEEIVPELPINGKGDKPKRRRHVV